MIIVNLKRFTIVVPEFDETGRVLVICKGGGVQTCLDLKVGVGR